jgi:hypothetical protein
MSTQVVINSNSKRSTKKEAARVLYKANHSLDRPALIKKFTQELGITENSARTHISWCAKELSNTLNIPFSTRNHDPAKLKKEKAYNIFKNHPNSPRKEIIQLYRDTLGMSPKSAATHCSLSAKRYADDNPTTAKLHRAVVG